MPRSFRVGLVQHNPTVGDVQGNLDLLVDATEQCAGTTVDLLVTPELSLLGYPPRDLLHRDGVLDAQRAALDQLRELTTADSVPALVVGAAVESQRSAGPPLHNAAVVLADGKRRATYAKRLLPTYDVFDEHRYFEPGTEPCTVDISGTTVGISICEDAWMDADVTGKRRHDEDPLADLTDAGADVIVTLSASPFSLSKPDSRIERFADHATSNETPVVFVNQAGGNDDVLFDGYSLVVGPDGRLREELPGFEAATAVVDPFETCSPVTPPERSRPAQARNALVMGLRDYLDKTGFSEVIIGLSGGIDSSVTATLAADALGPDHVYGVSLPSEVTSEQSVTDARNLAERLGIEFDVIPVGGAVETMTAAIESATDETVDGLAAENIQARVRGGVLMTLANSRGALVLTPDNKSEAAVGYCTLYGDTVGALAPLGDCYKTLVYELASHYNEQGVESSKTDLAEPGTEPPIPERVIEKEPTAELREEQTDEEDLPAYEQLDPVLRAYIHGTETGSSLRERFPDHVVDEALARIARSEFKRWQTPPALRITDKAFGRGWKYPIAAAYESVIENSDE